MRISLAVSMLLTSIVTQGAPLVNVWLCDMNSQCLHPGHSVEATSSTGPLSKNFDPTPNIYMEATADFGLLKAYVGTTEPSFLNTSDAVARFQDDLVLGASSGTLWMDFLFEGSTFASQGINGGTSVYGGIIINFLDPGGRTFGLFVGEDVVLINPLTGANARVERDPTITESRLTYENFLLTSDLADAASARTYRASGTLVVPFINSDVKIEGIVTAGTRCLGNELVACQAISDFGSTAYLGNARAFDNSGNSISFLSASGHDYTAPIPFSDVPEPATFILGGLGIGTIILARRKKLRELKAIITRQ